MFLLNPKRSSRRQFLHQAMTLLTVGLSAPLATACGVERPRVERQPPSSPIAHPMSTPGAVGAPQQRLIAKVVTDLPASSAEVAALRAFARLLAERTDSQVEL